MKAQSGMPTTLPDCRTGRHSWILQQMDKKLKALPEVDRVFREDRRSGYHDRSRAAHDDRNNGAPEAEIHVAEGDDEGPAGR
jgi:hypothetical protein